MKILALTSLYPPHHAGTYDYRCHDVCAALRQRGHLIRVLTSNHSVGTEQRDPEIERRLWLNGVYEHPLLTEYRPLLALERHNHEVLRETVADFQPDLLLVFSLTGLSKSFIIALRNARLPFVFDIADDWLAAGVRADPWLRWWNTDHPTFTGGVARAALEASGQRNALDDTVPTRPIKGIARLPAVFGKPEILAGVTPNSVDVFRFDRLYFCSRSVKERSSAAGFKVDHGEVIYPGIVTEQFAAEPKPLGAPLKRLLIVGPLTHESGVKTALDALRQAREYRVAVTLDICGRGQSDYVAQLRSYVVQHQLPVDFIPVPSQPKEFAAVYRQRDALLYTAEWEEPFPTTVIEAMASGLPVVGATIGGAAELLRHGENAFTFSPGNAMELTARLHELQSQPALRRTVAETAQADAFNRFNQTTAIDQIENYLELSLEIWQHT